MDENLIIFNSNKKIGLFCPFYDVLVVYLCEYQPPNNVYDIFYSSQADRLYYVGEIRQLLRGDFLSSHSIHAYDKVLLLRYYRRQYVSDNDNRVEDLAKSHEFSLVLNVKNLIIIFTESVWTNKIKLPLNVTVFV